MKSLVQDEKKSKNKKPHNTKILATGSHKEKQFPSTSSMDRV